MKKTVIDSVEFWAGSGNAYADPGFPDAEKLKIKTTRVIGIRKSILLLLSPALFTKSRP